LWVGVAAIRENGIERWSYLSWGGGRKLREESALMIGYLLAGFSLGLSAGLSPGPLLALVISQTMQYGAAAGIKTAVAPLLTDVPIVTAVTLALATLTEYHSVLGVISLAGSFLLAYMAYENLHDGVNAEAIKTAAKHSIMRGAFVNALSPHPYLFWIMIGSPLLLSALTQGWSVAACFLLSFYSALVGAKVAIAIMVNKSRNVLTGRFYSMTMKGLGLILLIFAGILGKEGLTLLMK
jgi:threonine/homoserine/homoserine lactone efflux protein